MQKVCHNNNQAIEIPMNKGVNILESIDPKPANTGSSRSNTKKKIKTTRKRKTNGSMMMMMNAKKIQIPSVNENQSE